MSDDKNKTEPPKGSDDQGQTKKEPEPKGDPKGEPKKAAGDGDGGSGGDDKNLASQLAIAKKRAIDAEAKLDKLEKEKLEKDGDLKGLLAKSEKRANKLLEELKGVKVKTLQAKLNSEFARHAPDAQDLDLLSKLDEIKKNVNMDHDTLEITGVKEAVSSVRKSHPYLFKQKVASGWGGPAGIPIDNKKADASDVDAFMAAMRKAKTPRDKYLTRKEFNREL